MRLEQTMAGWEARLKPRAADRWGGAPFLGVWLVFWVLGEGFALWILIAGGWALVTGQPPGPGRAPLEPAPALLTGGFLLAWLAFWTLGGLLAWHEFLRLTWSEDRLVARSDGLELARRVGPFTRRRFLPRDGLRGFFRVEAHTAVQAETTGGTVELTRNGTPAEQERLIAVLTAELRLPAPERLPPVLPADWRELRVPEGGEVIVRSPDGRRTAARVMWLIALPLAWGALALMREAWDRPSYGAAAAMLTVVAGLAVWGAVRLTWAREEWRLEPGRLVRQRRFGSRVREGFVGVGLRLAESTDGDGDRWFQLELLGPGDAVHPLRRQMHDPTEPRQLGQWLAARLRLLFEDRATPAAIARAEAEKAAWQAEQRRLLRQWLGEWIRQLPGFRRRGE
ncbi:MAG: hypothetical protein JNG83_13460 [Opitutaceae bacterium]|nr:hypothetical protein [Opitutaceae bacterium]